MTIETKFNLCDNVYFIYENKIVCFPVKSISCDNTNISYKFAVWKSEPPSMSDDTVACVDEENCFSSIKQLCDFWDNKLNPIPF